MIKILIFLKIKNKVLIVNQNKIEEEMQDTFWKKQKTMENLILMDQKNQVMIMNSAILI